MKRIQIFDTTLRDGEQSPGASMSHNQKVKMAVALEKLGVDRIEAGFPVSSKVQFNAVQQIAQTVRDATVVALARCVDLDIDAANNALKDSKKKMIHLFLASSPIHRKHKLKMDKKEVLHRIREKLKYASLFFDKIEFMQEFRETGRTEKFERNAVEIVIVFHFPQFVNGIVLEITRPVGRFQCSVVQSVNYVMTRIASFNFKYNILCNFFGSNKFHLPLSCNGFKFAP